jgi:hypothetical protein
MDAGVLARAMMELFDWKKRCNEYGKTMCVQRSALVHPAGILEYK